MKVALKGKPETPPGPMPDGLSKINGDFYFSEFPPGKAVARVGLPAPTDMPSDGSQIDSIGSLLNQLHGSDQSGHSPATSSSSTGDAAQPVPIHFDRKSTRLNSSH